MRTIKLQPYIAIGLSLRYLLDLHEGTSYSVQQNRLGRSCQRHLLSLRLNFFTLGFKVTLQAYKSELEPWEDEANKRVQSTNSDFLLTQDDVQQLRERAEQVLTVLRHEAVTQTAYMVTEKRIDVAKLLGDIAGLFGESVFDRLPDLARYDFQQSGRCVALDVPTAAAFHILRGTEGVLRMYHDLHIPGSESPPQMWGPIVHALRRHQATPPVAGELLDNLDSIRVNYRNPTQHPEKVYDSDEVQDLFNLCVSVVNSMVKDLVSRKLIDTSSDIPF